MRKPKTMEEYLSSLPAAERDALEKLRRAIRSIVPEAEECISYSIPAFRYRGKVIGGFAARKNGFSYFPFSGSTLSSLSKELGGYGGTKSALHFEKALPHALVRKLLAARIAELSGKPEGRVTSSRRSAAARTSGARRAPGGRGGRRAAPP